MAEYDKKITKRNDLALRLDRTKEGNKKRRAKLRKDIKEVQNAWLAYNEMTRCEPWSVGDLLKAHAHLTDTLIGESGQPS